MTYRLAFIFFLTLNLIAIGFAISLAAQSRSDNNSKEAEQVVNKAIAALGGEKYLNVKTQVGRGKFSILRDGTIISFQSFVNVVVFPGNERTEFKSSGVKTVQTNSNGTGWIFDGNNETIRVQTDAQLENFERGLRVSIDNLLRGYWKAEAELTFVGKRPATLGKRNDVVSLKYSDGFVVEFEIGADDGLPAKAIYKRTNSDGEEITEEDRYAQFLDFNGIKSPFVIDRFSKGVQTSRVNFESIEFNKAVPDSIFAKPANPKELKKDLKL